MRAISVQPKGMRADGKTECEVLIVSNDTPNPLPTTGENVIGMSADQAFAPFSVLYVVADVATKVYIADEDGIFRPQ